MRKRKIFSREKKKECMREVIYTIDIPLRGILGRVEQDGRVKFVCCCN